MGGCCDLQSIYDRDGLLFDRVIHAVNEEVCQPGMTVIEHHVMAHVRDDDQPCIMDP